MLIPKTNYLTIGDRSSYFSLISGINWGGMKLLLCVILFGSILVATKAQAATLNGATITVDDYEPVIKNGLGGANFIAHYALNSCSSPHNCVTTSSLHWIQLTTTSKQYGPGFPNPNRPFIDPSPGQNIGNGQVGNATPFYDITVSNINNFTDYNKWQRDGSGKYIGDSALAPLTDGLLSFTADSLLVSLQGNQIGGILGGVQWGYTISASQTMVSTLPLVTLSDNAALEQQFNTALALYSPSLSIKPTNQLFSSQAPFVTAVPEPSMTPASVLAGSFILILLRTAGRMTHSQRQPPRR